jgi:hypothetical protein
LPLLERTLGAPVVLLAPGTLSRIQSTVGGIHPCWTFPF